MSRLSTALAYRRELRRRVATDRAFRRATAAAPTVEAAHELAAQAARA